MAINDDRAVTDLPHVLGAFIGRAGETAEILSLLATARLFTLTGMGGSGKTRLAAQVATQIHATFRNGVQWVDLSALADPSLVPDVVATRCGVADHSSAAVLDALVSALRSQHLLLVLDNCEHLLTACAHLIETLLGHCPDLHVLATSREPLAIPGEVIWLVPPLRVPEHDSYASIEELLAYESAQLFVMRATAVLPAFRLTLENAPNVARICQRVEGLPLALELAAARLRTMSLEEIAERLDDACRLLTRGSRTAHQRQQTLRATLDWSYDLLSDPERTVFRQLACFAGSFSFQAAEVVCDGASLAEIDVLDVLTRLVEKSLVTVQDRQRETRYRLLEPLRHYAQDRLAETGTMLETHQRHRDWYAALAAQAAEGLSGQDQGRWLNRLAFEHDNIRAALSWSLARGDAASAGEIAAGIWQFWLMRGHRYEGRRWMAQILTALPEPTSLRAHLLWIAGILARPDALQAQQLLRESLALWQHLGDRDGTAQALSALGVASQYLGAHAQAAAYFEQSLPLLRGVADTPMLARTLTSLALSVLHSGDDQRAMTLCYEGLALHQQVGDLRGSAATLANIGLIWQARRDEQRAAALWEESLALRRRIGDQGGAAHVLALLGGVAVRQGAYARASELYQESLALRQQSGDQEGVASILEGLTALSVALGHFIPAVQFAAATDVVRATSGMPLSTQERTVHDRTLATLHTHLNEAAFARAWAEGQRLSLDQVMTIAKALHVREAESTPAASSTADLFSPQTAQPATPRYDLTPREIEVLRLLSYGLTYAQIAETLVISRRTVDAHARAIFGKLDVRSRTAATRIALQHGLI
jgi:predicted ATPase/DNA-binding CsgD family transcriptional regulator